MSERGLFNVVTAEFVALECRRDLASPISQRLLAEAHHTVDLRCLCGARSAVRPRRLPSRAFTACRENIDDHAADCWLHLDRVSEAEAQLSLAAFSIGEASEILGQIRSDCLHTGVSGPETRGFGYFANQAFSCGLAEAVKWANSAGENLITPSAIESLRAVDALVQNAQLRPGLSASEYVGAQGGRLRHGLVFDSPNAGGSLNIYWFGEHGFSLQLVALPRELMNNFHTSVSRWGRPLSPPYWVAAIQDQFGVLRNLWAHMVHAGPIGLFPVDSVVEAKYLQFVRSHTSTLMLKPLVLAHSITALRALGWKLPDADLWPGIPDLFVVSLNTFRLRECVDFAINEHPEYHARLQRKLYGYSQLLCRLSPDIRAFETYDRASLPDWNPSRPEFWPATTVSFEAPSIHQPA